MYCRIPTLFAMFAANLLATKVDMAFAESSNSVVEQCLASREKLVGGIIEFVVSTPDARGAHLTYVGVERHYAVALAADGQLYRGVQEWKSRRSAWKELALLGRNETLYDRGELYPHGYYAPTKDESVVESRLDPRLFGLVAGFPTSLGSNFKAHALWFARDIETDPVLVEDEVNGEPALRGEYQASHGRAITAWYSRKYGFNPLRIVKEIRGSTVERHEVHTEYSEVSANGGQDKVWFPSFSSYSIFVDGEFLVQEDLKVTRCDFDHIPAESEFTVAALPIPPGRRYQSGGREYLFDHSKPVVRRATTSDHRDPTSDLYLPRQNLQEVRRNSSESGMISLILIANACIATILVVVFLARRRRTASPASP